VETGKLCPFSVSIPWYKLQHFIGQVRAYGKAEIIYPGLILNWAGYDKTVGGVERIMPSRCGLVECPPGYTGDKCEVLEKDKIPPTVEYCPPGEFLLEFINGTTTFSLMTIDIMTLKGCNTKA